MKNDYDKTNILSFVFFLVLGLWISASPTGMKDLPDIDMKFQSVFGHRSILFHSIFFPYLFYFLIKKKKNFINSYFLIFSIGNFLGMGIHLVADFFPTKWEGLALIKLFGNYDIGALSSFWVGFNALGCIFFSSYLIIKFYKKFYFLISYFFTGTFIGALYSLHERHNQLEIFLCFFATLIISIAIAILVKKNLVN